METNTPDIILDLIKEEMGLTSVSPEMSFEECGMDSLDYILLIQEVRKKLGPVTTKQAQELTKVRDLIAIFEQ